MSDDEACALDEAALQWVSTQPHKQKRATRLPRPHHAAASADLAVSGHPPAKSRAEILEGARAAKRARRTRLPTASSLPEVASSVVVASSSSVPASVVRSIVSDQGAGSSLGRPVLMDHVRAALLHHGADHGECEALQKCADLLCNADGHARSDREMCEKLGVSRKELGSMVALFASSLSNVDKTHRYELELGIAALCRTGKVEPIIFLEYHRYDETPMKVVLKHVAYGSRAQKPRGSSADEEPTEFVVAQQLGKEHALAKLFQTESTFAMLLKIRDGASSEFFAVHGCGLNHLQILERTTAEVLSAALAQTSGVSRHIDDIDFKLRVRACTTDKYSANMAAEKQLVKSRGSTWTNVHFTCDVHTLSVSMGKTFAFAFAEEQIVGLIHAVLSIVSAGYMRRWRKCIQADIEERVDIRIGHPSPEDTAWRQHVLELFMGRGRNVAERRCLLARLPNGDWRESKCIPVIVPPHPDGLQPNRRRTVAFLQRFLVKALASHQLTVYPRHRWTGADISIDELAIGIAVNQIFVHSYRRFCMSFGPTATPHLANSSAAVAQPPVLPELGLDAPTGHEGRAGEGQEGGADSLAFAQHDLHDDLQAVDDATGDTDWAQRHARFRSKGLLFMESQPLAMLMALRRVLEPLRKYQARLFHLSSHRWERQQQARDLAGAPGPQRRHGGRRYRAEVVASGEFEEQCLAELRALLCEEAPWQHIPLAAWTLNFRHQLFKLISRASCAIEELLRHPHTCYPYRAFVLLADPSFSEVLADEPACLLDQFTLEWRERFREAGLSSPEALNSLRLAALLIFPDIASIECLHASVRRFLAGKVQTHGLSASFLAAQWLCSRYRSRQAKGAKARHSEKQAPKQRKLRRDRQAKAKRSNGVRQRAGRGGAWRVFISEREKVTKGSADFSLLAAAYRELPFAERARLALVGKAATKAGKVLRKGASAFGPSTRGVRLAAAKRRRLAVLQRELDGAGGEVALPSAQREGLEVHGPLPLAMGAQVTAARSKVLSKGALDRMQDQRDEEAIISYRAGLGQARKKSLMEKLPQLASSADALVPDAHRDFHLLQLAPASAEAAVRVSSFSLSNEFSCNLSDCLQTLWSQQCHTIAHTAMPKPPERERNEVEKSARAAERCRSAGICLCDEKGAQILRFDSRLKGEMRTLFGKGKPHRQLLANGDIVLLLRSQAAEAFGADFAGPGLPDEDIYWLHVGMQYFKPLRPTFQELALPTGVDFDQLPADEPIRLVPRVSLMLKLLVRFAIGGFWGAPCE